MSETASVSPKHWRLLLVAGVLLGFSVFANFPQLQNKTGIFSYGVWFLDSYAVLAASDTYRAGGDPAQPMALDALHRPHSYSDWWYQIGRLGVTRDDNFLVGGSWVLAFLVAVFWLFKPTNGRQAALYLSLLLSHPVLLAFIRANNDLVVFVLLVLAAIGIGRATQWGIALAIAAIGLATGLKFYPVVAGAVFLLVRPRGRMITAGVIAAAVLGLIMLNVANQLGRGVFAVPRTFNALGAALSFPRTGWSNFQITAIAATGLTMAAFFLIRMRWVALPRVVPEETRTEFVVFVLGAVVLLSCFIAGISHNYRWVFSLMLVPWLWRQSRESAAAGVALALTTFLVWGNMIFYLTINLLAGPEARPWGDAIEPFCMVYIQILTWALMALLSGWLLQVLLEALRDLLSPARSAAVTA